MKKTDMDDVIINITGDLVVNQRYDSDLVHKDIINHFQKADYNIVNLECPVTEVNDNHRIIKTGPYLKAHKESILEVLQSLKISGATLANNHILDYGRQGLLDTIEFCETNKIDYLGAGENLNQASQPLRINIKGLNITFLNIAENEWSIADDVSSGANPIDIIENLSQIRYEKKQCDYLILIVHGGNEYRELPSPRIQKLYRFFVDEGADLVISHHTHCFSGIETYNDVSIYYGLGNFLFTKDKPVQDWYHGIVLQINVSDTKIRTEVFFTKMFSDNFELSFLRDEELSKAKNKFDQLSDIILNKELMNAKWTEYLENKEKAYQNLWSPVSAIENRYIRGMMKKLGITFLNKYVAKYYLNLMRCESHYDVSKAILKKYLNS